MPEETLKDRIKKVLQGTVTDSHHWVVVRFRDLWKEGLHNVRKDKLEEAMSEALKEFGINLDEPGYINYVTTSGATLYINATDPHHHPPGEVLDKIFKRAEELITPTPTPTPTP